MDVAMCHETHIVRCNDVPALAHVHGDSRLPIDASLVTNEKRAGGTTAPETQFLHRHLPICPKGYTISPPLLAHLHVPRPHSHRSPDDEPNRSARHKTGASSLVHFSREGRAFFSPECEPCWPPHYRQQISSSITLRPNLCSLFLHLHLSFFTTARA